MGLDTLGLICLLGLLPLFFPPQMNFIHVVMGAYVEFVLNSGLLHITATVMTNVYVYKCTWRCTYVHVCSMCMCTCMFVDV